MKSCVISLLILATGTVFTCAQEGKIPAADAAQPARTLPPQADNNADKDQLELIELGKKEAGEIRALQEKTELARKKMMEEIKGYQDQIEQVRKKYSAEKYAIMDRINPGSGTKLAKRDKDLADLEVQLKKDLNALNTAQSLEASKGPLTKEKQIKFQTDRNGIVTRHNEKKREILSR